MGWGAVGGRVSRAEAEGLLGLCPDLALAPGVFTRVVDLGRVAFALAMLPAVLAVARALPLALIVLGFGEQGHAGGSDRPGDNAFDGVAATRLTNDARHEGIEGVRVHRFQQTSQTSPASRQVGM